MDKLTETLEEYQRVRLLEGKIDEAMNWMNDETRIKTLTNMLATTLIKVEKLKNEVAELRSDRG